MIEYRGYIAAPEYSLEDDSYSGMALNAVGVIHFEGETLEEAKTAFMESVDEHLDFCDRHGIAEKPEWNHGDTET